MLGNYLDYAWGLDPLRAVRRRRPARSGRQENRAVGRTFLSVPTLCMYGTRHFIWHKLDVLLWVCTTKKL